MRYSSQYLLKLLQKSLKNPRKIQENHSLLITNGHLFCDSKPQVDVDPKWMATLLYNTLIRAYLIHGNASQALLLFTHMLAHQAPPNSHTFPSLIKSAATCSSSLGKSIHTQALKRGVLNDPFIPTSFVSFYAEFGELRDARKMFEEITEPCIVARNAMLHALAKNGDMGSAVLLFENSFDRDVVSWTSIINGLGRNGYFVEAIGFFKKMMKSKHMNSCLVKPNEATYVSVLSSCANLDRGGALCRGREVHGYVIKNEELTVNTGTSLIDFYGKMGWSESAMNVFNLMKIKGICSYNAMISSLACNGKEEEALELFSKMKIVGFRPNAVTFVAVLTACARGKLIKVGLELFESMSNEFLIEPVMEHYGCMVDLLGRSGLLKEAAEFVNSMPFEPDGSVLGALLGACKIHGAIEIGNEVGRRLLLLQPLHSGRYIVLANVNASVEKWGYSADLRKEMADAGIAKVPAFSTTD